MEIFWFGFGAGFCSNIVVFLVGFFIVGRILSKGSGEKVDLNDLRERGM